MIRPQHLPNQSSATQGSPGKWELFTGLSGVEASSVGRPLLGEHEALNWVLREPMWEKK